MQFTFTRPSFAFAATVLSVAGGVHGSITITSQSHTHELLVPNLASPPVPVVTQTPGFYEAVIAPQTYDIPGYYPIYPGQFISNVTDAASSRVITNETPSNLSLQFLTCCQRACVRGVQRQF